jgi:hypothetical protein
MFHTVHRTSVRGAKDFDREADRLIDELTRRGFFVGLGSVQALRVLADCSPTADASAPLAAGDDSVA